MIIRVQNNLADNAQKTFTSVASSSGIGTISVKNAAGFTANWAVQIGKTGEERSEVRVLGTATPSGTSLVVTANTSFDHPADTPIYAIKFDQIVFARSTSGTAGTATALTDGTVTITPDDLYTQFDDTTGASTYAYRTWFRNSVTTEESSQSDWLTPSGYSFYSLGKIRQRIKSKLFNANYLKDDSQIDDWINEWLEEMTNAAINVDKSYSMGTASISFGTSGLGTISSDDFKELKRVWITYNGNDKYKATKLDTSEINPNEVFSSTHPYYTWKGDNVIEFNPKQNGTAEIEYYKRNTVLTNDTDELPLSMRSYTNSFVNYALAEAYYNDDKEAKGDRYISRANTDLSKFVSQITPRSFVDVEMIEITHVVSNDYIEYL